MKACFLFAKAAVAFVFFVAVNSCSKEIDNSVEGHNSAASESINKTSNELPSPSQVREFFKAPFNSRGSRTIFDNYISDTTAILSLDYFIEKRFTRGEKRTTLTLNYGDIGLYSRGWKYEVTFDTVSNRILLSPNSAMTAETVPGSFKTFIATFDRASSTFTFSTKVKDLDGFVHQVFEIISRQQER